MGRNVAVHFGSGFANCALAELRVTNASAAALKETIVSSRHTTEIVSVVASSGFGCKDCGGNRKIRLTKKSKIEEQG
jgi:hypothetical protein